ncbi:mycofactocin biosynthesis glycosyltransferase MftF [Streptomyces sp. NBC_01361]|uniref:mycofactocin biosynthesis glycosyltransferase MftF n=1 Tax=Streptomyces sp. NBC_01361 TaxID=2903838 RepID=UPI002E30488B|nr:mycofactocin biosynthesis glycosyltransferase MftF [Streptomyces sp. NBC_01361]
MRLIPDPGLRTVAGGQVLIGGSPLRVLRLSSEGARLVTGWLDGKTVGTDSGPRRLAERLVRAGLAHPLPKQATHSAQDVTVVVPVRDHAEGLTLLRGGLRDTAVASVLLIDDGSASPVAGATVRHNTAGGPASARNAGAGLADTEFIAFLDADVVPQPGWLEPLLAHFSNPEVAVVAPRVRSLPGPTALARYERERSPLDLGPLPADVRPGSRVGYVPSAALVIRTAVLREHGGFDEGMRFGEDVDLIWRLVAAGHRVRYEPLSQVLHAPRATWPALMRQRFGYGTSAAPLARRHGRAVAPVRLSPWTALAWTAATAGLPRTGLGVALATAALLPRKLAPAGVPAAESLRLAMLGHLGAGRWLADAVVRSWWPVAVPVLASSRAGRAMLGLALVSRLRGRGAALDPARWWAAAVADDLAYGAGVWWGALRHRTLGPLLPDLTPWPWHQGEKK